MSVIKRTAMDTKKVLTKKRLVIIIILAVIILAVGGFVVAFFTRSSFNYKVKCLLKLGREKAVVSALSENEEETSSESLEEFLKRENVRLDQSLMLINSKNKIPEDFEADITEYKDTGVMMNSCMVGDYGEMSGDILGKFGQKLFVMSSYRTAKEQEQISKEEGSDKASAKGASEHQAGLSLDVYVSGFAGEGFLKSNVGKWVNENSWRYGFIIRYPYGKKSKTGFSFEPWHIRYVGYPHAEIMYRNFLCFEEYIDYLEEGKLYSFDGYVISKQSGREVVFPRNCQSFVISFIDNESFIITGKRS